MKYRGISFLSLGSNLGDRHHFLDQAIWEIECMPEVQIVKKSIRKETAPLENTNQPYFLNQILKVRVSSSYTLPCFLENLLAIEDKLGRKRRSWKGPREIDIDILSFEEVVMNTAMLTLPHHSLFTRPFIREIVNEMGELDLYSRFDGSVYEKYHSSV
ncbi:2-amino-4-hydroxy-6-hydroxymethyldihydropteridine diphosphokinase [Leptospira ryugenii]|uniref:2-amino-4-hydroxy-6-hydroxymethyldihydropteridine pyrophosphokinase n=1 Tax=Leptospira ryugenii TaxID=1917863 RepID=A0A2P2E2I6_9LEPT|nr:2-amino-4-hydroxy-6-hydroxymethyldihydropteridine diphosphokinase [Leptospira ryugenii]GBF51098.1 2-amino-4-hydroxy-6-hydroxymethyldihydropteridine diphosphokinase [Leptospira ryugenii]